MQSSIPLVMSNATVTGFPRLGKPEATFAAREVAARRISDAMSRFGMLLDILEEISKEIIPSAGDSDIRHGCERALTTILSRVAALDPVPTSILPPGPEEIRAKAFLEGERPSRLIDPDRLQGFWSVIHGILPVESDHVWAS